MGWEWGTGDWEGGSGLGNPWTFQDTLLEWIFGQEGGRWTGGIRSGREVGWGGGSGESGSGRCGLTMECGVGEEEWGFIEVRWTVDRE